mgnify:CR=1 FL=1
MNQVNYNAMSDAQLKQYFLKHRGDRAAFQAYLDRINQRSLRIIASPNILILMIKFKRLFAKSWKQQEIAALNRLILRWSQPTKSDLWEPHVIGGSIPIYGKILDRVLGRINTSKIFV